MPRLLGQRRPHGPGTGAHAGRPVNEAGRPGSPESLVDQLSVSGPDQIGVVRESWLIRVLIRVKDTSS
jgi:hypothetical protein